MLQFHGPVVTSAPGLLAYRELDDALGLSAMASDVLADARTAKSSRHALVGMLRQSVLGRLAGYEDVNDAERHRYDPAMNWVLGGKAAHGRAASAGHTFENASGGCKAFDHGPDFEDSSKRFLPSATASFHHGNGAPQSPLTCLASRRWRSGNPSHVQAREIERRGTNCDKCLLS
jgi:hypothetical protein